MSRRGAASGPPVYDHVWHWRSRLPERTRQPCRVVARGAMNSVLVEFDDGWTVVTSRYAVRRAAPRAPGRRSGHRVDLDHGGPDRATA